MAQSLKSSFKCAFAGIFHAARSGRNFKIELAIGLLAVVLGFAFQIEISEWAAVICCIAIVLGGECFNTALEHLVDLVSPEQNEHARLAKDCAAGAVLIAAICSLVVGIVIFAPRILALLLP